MAAEGARGGRSLTRWISAIALVVAVAATIGLLVLGGDDDDDDDTTIETEPTASVTTSPSSPSSLAPSSTGGGSSPTAEEAVTVVWPAPGGSVTYVDPVEAVRGFAEELVGFDQPILGELREGDRRSGEVEIRANERGPATIVLVLQMSDDNWYVIGSVTDDIELDEPIAGMAIDNPVIVAGRARAFEGTVQVAVFERQRYERLGGGFVTGSGGPDLGPFRGEIRWTNPRGGWGVVVLYTVSAEDGRMWQAVTVPVGFIGGD